MLWNRENMLIENYWAAELAAEMVDQSVERQLKSTDGPDIYQFGTRVHQSVVQDVGRVFTHRSAFFQYTFRVTTVQYLLLYGERYQYCIGNPHPIQAGPEIQ